MLLIAELSVNHEGNLSLAKDMIAAAKEAGADYAKTQAFQPARMRPSDPSRPAYEKAVLSPEQHQELRAYCQQVGIHYLSTPFDRESLHMLRGLGQQTFKIASTESSHDWWQVQDGETWFVSYPWGTLPSGFVHRPKHLALTAIPLYPTPLEAVGRAHTLDGYSDHCVGLDACLWAVQWASVIEVHLQMGDGRGRANAWDKTPQELRQLRDHANACETIRTGVSSRFRNRWSA